MGGFLFAGLLISSLGAVLDVAMTISSAMWELYAQNPEIGRRELLGSGMRVGGTAGKGMRYVLFNDKIEVRIRIRLIDELIMPPFRSEFFKARGLHGVLQNVSVFGLSLRNKLGTMI